MTHLAIVGPTASGKTELSLAIAQACGDVEIVSMDSMQVYRGLDIGTAKATPGERAAIRHHLIDVVDASEEWSVARFQIAVRAAVRDIESRQKRALLVGGTGLYVQAVVDDLQIPGEDLAIRAALLAATSEPGGVARAYGQLQVADPAAAARIEPHNTRRIVRALEVILSTGRQFSSFGPGVAAYGPTAFPIHMVGIWLPRALMTERIERRFERMRETGLLAEVQALRAAGVWSRTAQQAIGYKEVLGYLEGVVPSLDEAFDSARRRTRALARRQRMWFRRDPRICWIGSSGSASEVAAAILASWSR